MWRHDTPEIFNTDQGAASSPRKPLTACFGRASLIISMDGKGRWMDDVLIGRLCGWVQCEGLYLHAYDNPAKARRAVDRYVPASTTNTGGPIGDWTAGPP